MSFEQFKQRWGWTLSGRLPEHDNAQTATTFSASDHDQLANQMKSWSSSGSHASRCNVSGQSRDNKKTNAVMKETTKLSAGR